MSVIPDVEEKLRVRRKAIVAGVLQFVSPSQIEKFIECERKWGFSKIDGLKDEAHPNAAKGTAEHALLEGWMGGTGPLPPPHRPAYWAALELPKPGEGLSVEVPLERLRLAGLSVVGYIDLRNRRGLMPRITDYKFKGKLTYALKAEELAKSVQMNIYGAEELLHSGATKLEFQHIYTMLTPRETGKKVGEFQTRPVTVEVSVDSVTERLLEIESVVARMKVAAGAASARELRPTYTKFCEWCSFKEQCAQTPQERIAMALSDLLRPKVTVTAESSVPPVTTPAPVVGAVGILPPEVVAARESGGNAARTETKPSTALAKLNFKDESTKSDTDVKADAAFAAAVKEAKAEALRAEMKEKPQEELSLAPLEVPAPGEKPKRVRRTKAQIEADEAAHSGLCEGSVGKACDLPAICAPDSPAGRAQEQADKLSLYVDCYPVVGVEAQPLESVIEPIAEVIRKTADVGDLRLIDYGKGPAILAGELRRAKLTGVFFCRSGTAIADAAIEALIPQAAVVVRGLK